MAPAWRGGGGGGEDRGIVGPPSTPLPEKIDAGGRGVEGGVIIPNTKPAPTPTHPHPRDRRNAQNVCRLDGSGTGVGAGGNITTS